MAVMFQLGRFHLNVLLAQTTLHQAKLLVTFSENLRWGVLLDDSLSLTFLRYRTDLLHSGPAICARQFFLKQLI